MISSDNKEFLVIFDIDGTLINQQHKVNLDVLAKRIERFKQKNIKFGINTNRSKPSASYFYDRLKFNGPLIIEDGTLHKYSLNSKWSTTPKAKSINKIIAKEIYRWNKLEMKNKYSIQFSDIHNRKRPLIKISPDRIHTSSIYIVSNNLRCDFNEISLHISRCLRKSDHFYIKEFPDEGKIILGHETINRVDVLDQIVKKHYKNNKILIISDNEPLQEKFNYNKNNIFLSSVLNGDKTYLSKCNFIASKHGVSGIVKLISEFIE